MSAPSRVHREMTIANVREQESADHVEVLFLESARFYRLPKAHARFDELMSVLRSAMEEQRPVRVEQSSIDSDVIDDVRPV